jgi:hypothetical protein
MFTSNRTIKWIENLAEQELLIKAGEKASIDICTTKDEVLSVETATFVRDLFYHFDYLVQLFNARVNQPGLQIKLLRIGDQLEGFSVFRNKMKLLLTRPQAGIVQLQCDKLILDENSRPSKTSVMFSGLIEAKFGTFNDVEWYFLGSRVTAEQVARHYLTEFIQVSRAPSETA